MDTISAQSRDHLRQTTIDEITSLEASARALKSRRNTIAPISCLPPEILATIFVFLSAAAWYEKAVHLEWIRVAHICRRWREVALDHPRFWSHINFTNLTPDGMAEILARAKMAPLHLEADVATWRLGGTARDEAIARQLEAHISRTRHLIISGSFGTTLERLTSSSAPTLEFLSLLHTSPMYAIIPDNLFNCTAPNLTSLRLEKCDITWKSPLLKGLRILEIKNLSPRPELDDWLDALNEMPQLEELLLQSATPLALLAHPLIPRTVTLPSLIYLHIGTSAKGCALALPHLVLPTLTRLSVDVESHDREGEDVLLLIPYVVGNFYALQDIEPIRSLLIAGERWFIDVLTWTTPGADVKVCGLDTLDDMSRSARLKFSAQGCEWRNGVGTAIFDAFLTLLPMDFVSTLTAQNRTRLSKESWLGCASRLPLLVQVRLAPTAVGAFREMLVEDTPPDGPRLPSLTRLVLLDVTLTAFRTYHLRNMLIRRVEQGVPLEVLDLSTCVAADHTIQLLTEIVDVQEPLNARPMPKEEFFPHVGTAFFDIVEYDDARRSWHCDAYSEDGDEDDDEDEAGHDDEFYDYDDFAYNDDFEYNDMLPDNYIGVLSY